MAPFNLANPVNMIVSTIVIFIRYFKVLNAHKVRKTVSNYLSKSFAY